MKIEKNLLFQWLNLVAFVLVACLVYFGFNFLGPEAITNAVHPPLKVEAIRLGTLAPDFSVPTERIFVKKEFRLHQLKGYPVVLHFWATWCGPCLQELPEILKLAERLRPQGYSFVAVAIDQDWTVIEEFFARNPGLSPIRDRMILVLDPESKIANSFGSSRFPETFLINREMVIDNKFIGAQPWNDSRMLPYLDNLRSPAK